MNKNKKEALEQKALKAIAQYLESIGWQALVIGFDHIEQAIPKFNFRLIVKFTGKKKEARDKQ